MTIKVIIEFQTRPGQRTALQQLMVRLGEELAPVMRERGNLHYALYEALDDPDLLVEVAEWVSTEARETLVQEAMASGAFAPMMELMAAPPKATYVRQIV